MFLFDDFIVLSFCFADIVIAEEFLQHQNNFIPIRYFYSEIKKMTYGFKDRLG
jgi:hypothetical protein